MIKKTFKTGPPSLLSPEARKAYVKRLQSPRRPAASNPPAKNRGLLDMVKHQKK